MSELARRVVLPDGVVDRQPLVEVWIATGLRRRWRVVSEHRTFGEWDRLADAVAFVDLLVAGNPDMTRLA